MKLRNWATKTHQTRESINEMLSIFRDEGYKLPKDARTLLRTPRSISTVSLCCGSYSYFGIERAIRQCLTKNEWFVLENSSVALIVNIDGVPLFKSTSEQLWPILISFGKFRPLIVALYMGKSKPSPVNDFLKDFLFEYSRLKESGITVNGKVLSVHVMCYSCDVPARAFLKCIKGHAGYFSCERCTVQGKSENRRMVMPTIDSPKRTD
ncbi:hypothetical protein CAPTEDRAFT_132376 [Capitella teleta]|uniref:Uncharacterized protein n=1 Tax=Capitella teleta TaxID=283909 RepID=R7T5S3_CAPTE|nr:hypothetical protein CAPTEDRAFT_132376 [Capitella teleta]|eukprot:ELT88655.1 hypothetical protein CAPTEDRAFT_132376 [Capitella teleta]